MFSTVTQLVLSGAAHTGSPPLAYLDPGTGSMAIQIAIAGLLSSLYFLRSSYAQIKGWVATHRP
ncbi:MAG TPA: hypothetical protein VGH33_03865, partial [Isosphaeraceae bacterium]